MGLSKTDYAKYQFMILVLRALFLVLVNLYSANGQQMADSLVTEIKEHEFYIRDLMKEE